MNVGFLSGVALAAAEPTGFLAGLGVLPLIIVVLVIAAWWKIFSKAGKPGWAAIIPIYNIIVWLDIIGRPVWWVILFFIPVVNIVLAIIVSIDTAKVFGKGVAFGIVGLVIFSVIGYLILGFGSASYQGPPVRA